MKGAENMTINAKSASPKVVIALDWTGPDDLENPYNWVVSKRIYYTITPSLFAFVVYVPPLFFKLHIR
jgi:hypothetical protein